MRSRSSCAAALLIRQHALRRCEASVPMRIYRRPLLNSHPWDRWMANKSSDREQAVPLP